MFRFSIRELILLKTRRKRLPCFDELARRKRRRCSCEVANYSRMEDLPKTTSNVGCNWRNSRRLN